MRNSNFCILLFLLLSISLTSCLGDDDKDSSDGDSLDGDASENGDVSEDGDTPEDGDEPLPIECSGDTCEDPNRNIEWQKQSSAEMMDWNEAVLHCDNLSFAGESDWRLPTITELRSLIQNCPDSEVGGRCGIDEIRTSFFRWYNEAVCSGCGEDAGPHNGCYRHPDFSGECEIEWSSTEEGELSSTWDVHFDSAAISAGAHMGIAYVRCARDM